MDPILHRKAPPHKHQERSANGQVQGNVAARFFKFTITCSDVRFAQAPRAPPGLYPWLQSRHKAGVICHDATGNADALRLLERWP